MVKKPKDIVVRPPRLESTSSLFPPGVIKRQLTEQFEAPFNAYVTGVGRVVHAWNHLQESLAKLLALVLDTHDDSVFAIWYDLKSDRAQQGILKAAAQAVPDCRWSKKFPQAKDDLKWLADEAAALGYRRNLVVHAPCSVELSDKGFEISASFSQGHPLAVELAKRNILQEFKVCEHYAKALTEFATGLWIQLAGFAEVADEPIPWPQRPSKQVPPDQKTGQTPQGSDQTK